MRNKYKNKLLQHKSCIACNGHQVYKAAINNAMMLTCN